jgi:hypothetical protein
MGRLSKRLTATVHLVRLAVGVVFPVPGKQDNAVGVVFLVQAEQEQRVVIFVRTSLLAGEMSERMKVKEKEARQAIIEIY